jgi:hypothetical protein
MAGRRRVMVMMAAGAVAMSVTVAVAVCVFSLFVSFMALMACMAPRLAVSGVIVRRVRPVVVPGVTMSRMIVFCAGPLDALLRRQTCARLIGIRPREPHWRMLVYALLGGAIGFWCFLHC